MPETLRNTTSKIAHEGHPGIVLMKRSLHIKVWLPGIDCDATKMFLESVIHVNR